MKSTKKQNIFSIIILVACIAILPFAGLYINQSMKDTSSKDSKRNYELELTLKDGKIKKDNITSGSNKVSESKEVKVYTKDIKNGAGKVIIEITNDDETKEYEIDIKFEGSKWNILNEDMYEDKDIKNVLDDLSNRLSKYNAEEMSFSYNYMHNYFSSRKN